MTAFVSTPEIKSASMLTIIEEPRVSRYEISKKFGVSVPTVGNRVNWLIDNGLVNEDQRQSRNKRYGRGSGAWELVATDKFWETAAQTADTIVGKMDETERALYQNALDARSALTSDALVVIDDQRKFYPDELRGRPVESLSENLVRKADFLGKAAVLAEYSSILDNDELFIGQEGWKLLITAQFLQPEA